MCDESSSFSWMLRTESKIDVNHVFDLVRQTRVAVAYVQQHVTRMSSGDLFIYFFVKVALALLALWGSNSQQRQMRSRVETSPTTLSLTPWMGISNQALCCVSLCRSSSIYLRTTAAHQCPSLLTQRASTPLSWAVRLASWLCRERSARFPLTWQGKILAIKNRTSLDRTPTQPDPNTWEVNGQLPVGKLGH